MWVLLYFFLNKLHNWNINISVPVFVNTNQNLLGKASSITVPRSTSKHFTNLHFWIYTCSTRDSLAITAKFIFKIGDIQYVCIRLEFFHHKTAWLSAESWKVVLMSWFDRHTSWELFHVWSFCSGRSQLL